ncbi:CRISPR-associated endonuclease Cas2 [Microvenator marinus]|uniref:CRISPR-associated endoribonuclease Cas2 n=2 Tax=Microvenator marinus TaxID=2600177 RepID=A0A5B8Y055_9DELT|nr:CRISPR-associated endonuclease Cas2 [Microvenator marinus]
MMRIGINRIIITYDICDDSRRTDIFECLKGFGEHIQYSVFCVELNEISMTRLQAKLAELIQHDEDQVLFFDLGPVQGRGSNAVTAIGKPFKAGTRRAFVL